MSDNEITVRESYLEQMVESASPQRLLILLVEGAVTFITRALLALEKGVLDEVHTNLVKAQDIYVELVASLDVDAGEFAVNLAQIYQFMYNLLIEANLEKDKGKMLSALRLAEDIRDLWKEAVERAEKESESEEAKVDISPVTEFRGPSVTFYDESAKAFAPDPTVVEMPKLNITG